MYEEEGGEVNTELEKKAIDRLRAFEPESEPYYLCYSGGKDSDAIRILADLAGVKHDIVHNLTTADAPETVRYVRSVPGVQIDRPKKSMWRLIEEKMVPPTRLMRYCCAELKERGGVGRLKITGVRWAESPRRREAAGVIKIIGKPKLVQKLADEAVAEHRITKQGGLIMNMDNDGERRVVEQCYRTTSTMVNPIIEWTDADVWGFLCYYGCKSNPLYECGMRRIGCIGCPLGGYAAMKRDFSRWPAYKKMYIKSFDRMMAARRANGKDSSSGAWKDGESVFRWWIGDDPAQLRFEDLIYGGVV